MSPAQNVAPEPRGMSVETQRELLAALRAALPYVSRVASTQPTEGPRVLRQMAAVKDANYAREAIARAEAELAPAQRGEG